MRHRFFSQSRMPCELVVRAERARMQRPKRLGGDTKERRGAPRPRGRERTPRPSINRHLPRGQASNSVRANPPPRTAATGITRPQIVACPCCCTARIPRATATLHAHARRPVGQQLNEGAHRNYLLRGLSRPSLAPAPLEWVAACPPPHPPRVTRRPSKHPRMHRPMAVAVWARRAMKEGRSDEHRRAGTRVPPRTLWLWVGALRWRGRRDATSR